VNDLLSLGGTCQLQWPGINGVRAKALILSGDFSIAALEALRHPKPDNLGEAFGGGLLSDAGRSTTLRAQTRPRLVLGYLGRPLNASTQGRILSAAVGGDDDVRFLSRAGARVRNDTSGVFFAVR
jgi:hypothetical protein